MSCSLEWLHACVLSRFHCVRLFATLWTVARQAPLSLGFSRQEYGSGLPCTPPGDLPDPGIKPMALKSPVLGGWFFTTSATWEALSGYRHFLFLSFSVTELCQTLCDLMDCIMPGYSFLKFMSTELVMPSNHLILCCPLLLLPSIFPIIRVFSNESALCIRWPKYWNFSNRPSNEYSVLISFRTD